MTSLLSRCPVSYFICNFWNNTARVYSAPLLIIVQVTTRDKMETVCGVDPRAGRATLGRLGGGVAQVPGHASSTEFLAARRELPIWSHRQELVDAVQSNQVQQSIFFQENP